MWGKKMCVLELIQLTLSVASMGLGAGRCFYQSDVVGCDTLTGVDRMSLRRTKLADRRLVN